jgi:hypothetical protein
MRSFCLESNSTRPACNGNQRRDERKLAACVWNPTLAFLSLANQTSQHFCNFAGYYNIKFEIAYFSKKSRDILVDIMTWLRDTLPREQGSIHGRGKNVLHRTHNVCDISRLQWVFRVLTGG